MTFTEFGLLCMAVNLLFGLATGYLAARWGRSGFGWLLSGCVLGPIGIILLLWRRLQDRESALHARPGAGPASERRGGARVLLATEGSPSSTRAAEQVVATLGRCIDAVTLVTVLPLESAPGPEGAAATPRQQRVQAEVEQGLGPARAVLQGAGIACEAVTRFGDPAEEILRLAGEGGYDCIALGRRGHGAVQRLLLGSVSERVAKTATCPVILGG